MIKVLLVEDNINDAFLMRRMFRIAAPNQHDLTHCGCMEHAKRHAAEQPPDIVLLDLGLPDAQGIDAVHQMLAVVPQVPVVVMTGRGDDQMAAQALRAGAQDFLVKGDIAPAVVLRALRYAIERKALEERLFLEREQAQITLNAIGDAVIRIDPSGRISFLNHAAEIMTGLTLAAGEQRMSEDIRLTGPDGARVDLRWTGSSRASGYGQKIAASATLTNLSGLEVPVEYIVSSVADRTSAFVGAVYVLRDLSATRALALKLEHMTQHDALTGLPNRMLLCDRIRRAIAIADRHVDKPGIMFLDLDGFKHVNDSLGHAMGDKLLKSIADRLSACVRNSDTVSRLGGDEFVVLLTEIGHPEDAAIAANRMLEAVSAPHCIDQHELHVTTSIGVSLYPNDGIDAETLIKNADTAMYQAKAQGRQAYRFFEPSMNERAIERQSIEEGLRRAMERREFALHYQPKIDLVTGRISSAEALIRWTHPQRGNMPPAQFITVAEESGLILPIGKWVLREACRQAKAWFEAGLPLDSIAVNVSALEFQDRNFAAGVFRVLEEINLEPDKLELELTETVLMKRTSSAAATLKSLRGEGVRLAIDDFGTGYSSLSYLAHFPVNTLKIDQSFVRQITQSPPETSVVKAVMSMARSLNLRVVAEGVETRDELDFLQAQNCDEAQGYYFSRPVPAVEFEALLHAYA